MSKIIFDLDDTLYVSDELRNNREKVILVQLGIFDLIDSYYSAQDFGKIKPCEECFFMVDKGDICVGNNFKKDLEIPKQKGAITIFVGGFHKDADKSIKNIYELNNFLKGGYE